MTSAATFDRRYFWNASGLRSSAAQFLGLFAQAPARSAELLVARRAMACEFTAILPAACRGAVDAGCAALDEVERLEAKLSVYLDDSDLSFINCHASAASVRADAEVFDLLRASLRLSVATGGAFDPASGALINAWGFLRGPRRVPGESERAAAVAASGSGHVILVEQERTVRFARAGVQINLGAIGKGFAIDRALECVRRAGIRAALMQGGQSSLKGIGAPAGQPRGWAVDIGDPCRPDRPLGRVWLRDRALGTSGAANQFFIQDGRRYGHVLDPRIGWPAHGILSASAIARTAAEADALSTAFFVLGVDGTRRFLKERPDVSALFVVPAKTRGATPLVHLMGAADMEVSG